eukprot:TRINITY_DN325_c0_g1_i2.p1 TRINITY_DN325_c0_g1~~TRINITY_DN325_c0_g1_i2.p1  ORF type:complete len:559 (-),score=157.23 TRINITY_DN325_c0_g1_i2:61-1737(-)
MNKFASIVLGLCLCLNMVQGLNQIVRKGNLFFDSITGKQFWVKGVDYQPKNSIGQNFDVLADPVTINRDLPYLQALGLNAIRVYETNSSLNHDVCMQILDNAGIYVILDVPTPTTSITTTNPAWNQDLFVNFAAKIDAFATYGNILAYIASNEVSTTVNNTDASAYVKAAVRDVKAYVRSKGLSTPVGYAIADAGDIATAQEQYFACSGDGSDSPDFYGINIYRWCGNSTYQISGYDVVTQTFTNWPIAVLFSEYGCNNPSPRIFTEVLSLYSSNMTGVFSGGLVYEYSQEVNQFGLVQVNYGNNTVTPLIDYYNYQTQLAKVNNTASSATLSTYTYSPITVPCPAVNTSSWIAASSPLPPAINPTFCACALNSFTCRVNFTSSTPLLTTYVQQVVQQYQFLCGEAGGIYCANVATNAITGTYGIYSACDALTRLSSAMNAYYLANQGGANPATCDFGGFGKLQTPSGVACSNATTSSTQASTTRNTVTTSNSGDSSRTVSTTSTSTSNSASVTGTSTSSTGSSASGSSSSGSRTSTQENSDASAMAIGILSIVALLL